MLLSCAAALGAYFAAYGYHRRIGWLAAGLGVFLLTLLSPLNTLADGYLFSAHMAQHILLLLIVPALWLLSLPRSLSFTLRPRILAHPLVGWMAGVGAMWFWHAPALCNAAVSSRSVYALQTVSLLVLGTLFWRQILAPREAERLSPPGAVLYLFSACVACSALGIIVTFSPVTVCSIYSMPPPDRLGILPTIRDQLGVHAGEGSANRRTAHVGADVPHLSERDFRANRALVRRSHAAPGHGEAFMTNEARSCTPGLGAAPPTRIFPALITFPPVSRWERRSFFWGFITSWVILAVGGGLFIASLAGWISEIRRELKHD